MPHRTKTEPLFGWGHAPVAECAAYRPEKERETAAILQSHPGALIARGLGRAYGDAALQPEGVLRLERLNHCIAFDSAQGLVRAQAGVTLAELMAIFIPRGWLLPTIPGTRHATLGGAFACNVHGKNHYRSGDLAEHVLSVRLLLAGGESIECSRENYPDIFWATAGGMGMTGIIQELTLRLMPIASASLHALQVRVANTQDMLAAFKQHREHSDYMVGWIDHMASGDALGQGVFEAASHAPQGEDAAALADYQPARSKISVPVFLPPFVLNRYSMALYNRWRFKHASTSPNIARIDFNSFFHPLDGIGHWNRLYGKQGFFQYQCLIPETPAIAAHVRDFLAMVQNLGLFSFLAVIKYHRTGVGYLTFPLQGYSIALDFPNTAKVRALLPALDEWVAAHGGRVYLAKDATLSPELFDKMYGEKAQAWKKIIHDLDPKARFSSLMSQRLQWKSKP